MEAEIREYRPGDPSRAAYFYFRVFADQFDFNGTVEQYFISNMAELWDDPDGNMLWIAEKDGQVVGSIMIINKGNGVGQLRFFGVDANTQGEHIDKRLMDRAMSFCKEKGYKHVYLWTIDICEAARHLYGKYGFYLTDTKSNTTWAAYPMTEERWDYFEQGSRSMMK